MRQHLLLFCLLALALNTLSAQSGCPGCVINLPANLPADTLYLPPLPDAEKGTPYDRDISFRVPKTTTPVYAVDSVTPPGLTISKIEIVGIEDMPPGLSWEASKTVFETAVETDGCIKICGTPLTSDSFVMTVRLKATVVIFNQEASFPLRLYVAPKSSTTTGFSMTGVDGCGSTTVAFQNNVPSNGVAGFTYEWDFGDGTTYTGENPPPHTYNQPGTYAVKYKAVVDTTGYLLVNAKVLSVSCTDIFNAPDLYLFLRNPAGVNFFQTPEVTNAVLPQTYQIGIKLDPAANYTLEVWDEDSGLEGADDLCGAVPFNILSTDTITSGQFKVLLNIQHPMEEIISMDTVVVYPVPAQPSILSNMLEACEGTNAIVLQSSNGGPNTWLLDGEPIPGATTDFLYLPSESGFYQVQVSNTFGCTATSSAVEVVFHPLPEEPAYQNDRNNLELIDTTALPASYALQWYLFSGPIAGATGFEYCATTSGTYSLVVTDLETGCTRSYTTTVTVNPNFDCTVGTGDLAQGSLNIFPNPTSSGATVQFGEPLGADAVLRVWDVAGRLQQSLPVGAGAERIILESGLLSPGLYFLEMNAGEKRFTGRLVVIW